MALEQADLSAKKSGMLVGGKETNTLNTLHMIAKCVKNKTTRKTVSFSRGHRLSAVHPQLLSVMFDSTFKNNVNHFRVLHWQQWQLSASTLDGYFVLQ